MDFLLAWDTRLFLAINNGQANQFFDWLMPFVTNLKNFAVILAVAAIALMIIKKREGIIVVCALGIALGFADGIASNVIKKTVDRDRPCITLENHGCRALMGRKTSPSFPSAHAANTFAAAVVLTFYYRRKWWLWFFIALVISYSRIYVGVHYPLDVIAGAAVGVLAGKTVTLGWPLMFPVHARDKENPNHAQ